MGMEREIKFIRRKAALIFIFGLLGVSQSVIFCTAQTFLLRRVKGASFQIQLEDELLLARRGYTPEQFQSLPLPEKKRIWEEIQKEKESLLALIREFPIADLHIHPSGSIRAQTFLELARKYEGEIDWSDLEESYGIDMEEIIQQGDLNKIRELLAYPQDLPERSLKDYLRRYDIVGKVLRSDQDVERVAFEIGLDSYAEGVKYVELRFNPINSEGELNVEGNIRANFQGLNHVAQLYPDFRFGLVVIFKKEWSRELARRVWQELLRVKQDPSIPREIRRHLIGIDTAGNEIGFDPFKFEEIFREVRESKLFHVITSHAGEAYNSLEEGLDAIEQAVDILGVNRIGHALALGIAPELLLGKRDNYAEVYTPLRVASLKRRQAELISKLKEKKIMVELTPTSNVQTGNISTLYQHPFYRFFQEGIPIVFGTDARTISFTTPAKELLRLMLAFDISWDELIPTLRKIAGRVNVASLLSQELALKELDGFRGELARGPHYDADALTHIERKLNKIEALFKEEIAQFQDYQIFEEKGRKPLKPASFEYLVSLYLDVWLEMGNILGAIALVNDISKSSDYQRSPQERDRFLAGFPFASAQILQEEGTFRKMGFEREEELALLMVANQGWMRKLREGEIGYSALVPLFRYYLAQDNSNLPALDFLFNIILVASLQEGFLTQGMFEKYQEIYRWMQGILERAKGREDIALEEVLKAELENKIDQKGREAVALSRIVSLFESEERDLGLLSRPFGASQAHYRAVTGRIFEDVPQALDYFYQLLTRWEDDFRFWYPYSALTGLKDEAKLKLLFLSLILADRMADSAGIRDINFYPLISALNTAPDAETNIRVLEDTLDELSLQKLLEGSYLVELISEGGLGRLKFRKVGPRAVVFEFN